MRISTIFNEIKSFRLGYTEEQPYPWRWTTPVVLCAFLLISPFLALVNVPLSAYNIILEFTYHPNDTLPAVFLANIVPSVLQDPTDSFTPQPLNVGDTIVLDNFIFNYTISQAFDGVNPVSAFPYYNNPLSDSCDVANITVQLLLRDFPDIGWAPFVQVRGTVACDLPTRFYLTPGEYLGGTDESSVRDIPNLVSVDFEEIFKSWSGPDPPDVGGTNFTQFGITITVHPCCKCEAVLAGGPLESAASLHELSCSSNPVQFVVVGIDLSADVEQETTPTPHFAPVSLPTKIADVLTESSLGNVSISALSTAYGNLIQAFYHLVRLDLGVILQNQIYNSSEMFSRTIMELDSGYSASQLSRTIMELDSGYSANQLRTLTSNATFMAQWQQDVDFFKNNTRVPPPGVPPIRSTSQAPGFRCDQRLCLNVCHALGYVDGIFPCCWSACEGA
ncbi:hypothetical protein MSAN_02304700 [Mycena sanguinolenta]|uniref:Uncharacterized protein n=1 Tax=Mycena sanguinolenta TaxID=230812 RepID=A0A8H6X9L1_9AGAR|nr:hypothetical protein MSAN_02304700 [Mycena sanguinolenta]